MLWGEEHIESTAAEAAEAPAAPEALINELKSRLSATILDRFKKPVAAAQSSSEHQLPWDDSVALKSHVTPTITVASSYVVRGKKGRGDEEKGPVHWDSWTDHGEVFRPHLGKTGWRSA
ncbi:hypothetical protein E1B28_013017 [Marasmius oreades]|uniref:Uncharacterized protein n=1 Tax=Marasmius oreades TaxID=181124 RepID=A0A9P7RPM3_9AGAR|nr:uncharacterized protein E1B28_013017 [Marasmius oreades]KAG7087038.1 hypothetical protein E1B28_013017 [Marasmius oreades]